MIEGQPNLVRRIVRRGPALPPMLGPLGWGRRAVLLPWRLRHRGSSVQCPSCGFRAARFAPAGVPLRQNAMCPRCLSLERHRALWLFLQRHSSFFAEPLRIMVVAPDGHLERVGRRLHPDYLSVDFESGLAMRRMDLRRLDLPDMDRDLIIAYHVLEHIREDASAMKEIRRVLRPDGFAILEVPLKGDETDERFIDAPPRCACCTTSSPIMCGGMAGRTSTGVSVRRDLTLRRGASATASLPT